MPTNGAAAACQNAETKSRPAHALYAGRRLKPQTRVVTLQNEFAFWANTAVVADLIDSNLASMQGTGTMIHRLQLRVSLAEVLGPDAEGKPRIVTLASYGTRYVHKEHVANRAYIFQFNRIPVSDRAAYCAVQTSCIG